MKKLILLLHFTFSIFHFSFSQTAPGIEWQNTIGGSGYDDLWSIDQTSDGGYICGGFSYSGISGDKTDSSLGIGDYWLLKLDATGNIQWQKTIGGNDNDWLFSVSQTQDGGYICGGWSWSTTSSNKTENNWDTTQNTPDYWIVKLDSTGSIQWDNTIGGTGTDYLYAIQQTNDGGYVCGGYSYSALSGDKTEGNWDTTLITSDCWIIKLDAAGNIQWQNTIGGNKEDWLRDIAQTTDGGYIFGGASVSNISGDKTENNVDTIGLNPDYWLVKIDSTGNIQWQNTIGGLSGDVMFSIKQTSDGGYFCGGISASTISGDKTEDNIGFGTADYWVLKLDTAGNIEWQKTLGGTRYDYLTSVLQISDGGYMCSGHSDSDSTGNKTENTNGSIDYWLVKLDSTGNISWQNTIGGGADDAVYAIQQTTNGGIICAGSSLSSVSGDKTENNLGDWDYWIIKLYPDTSTGIFNIQSSTNNIQLYPNPAKDEITITGYTVQNNQAAQLKIFDVMGKEVLSQPITNLHSQIVNLKSFATGVYYLQLQSRAKIIGAKFVKE